MVLLAVLTSAVIFFFIVSGEDSKGEESSAWHCMGHVCATLIPELLKASKEPARAAGQRQ